MDDETGEEPKPSLVKGLIVPLAVVVLFGAGAGWGLGAFILAPKIASPAATAQADAGAAAHGGEKAGAEAKHDAPAAGPQVTALDPIVTNIAVPSATWMRLELSLVLNETLEPHVADYIHQDLLAFARTLRLDYVDTPTGYLQFRNDLLDRARLRAGPGKIEQVLIKTMLFE
ncbi:MAG: flagellar basal body-associated FliL family protein [Brucellaceae bacterium]|nr:flagellar basal body-associated FliL family protein [Notoacmeibacter sp.]MCC0025468.1 flagellar basal body-associated FliL family protein [Brucellaceae bacterium]